MPIKECAQMRVRWQCSALPAVWTHLDCTALQCVTRISASAFVQAVRKLIATPAPLSRETRQFCAAVLVDVGCARKTAGAALAALSCYTEALSTEPQYHQALFHIGVLAGESGRPSDAQALYERAVAADPSNVQVRPVFHSASRLANLCGVAACAQCGLR